MAEQPRWKPPSPEEWGAYCEEYAMNFVALTRGTFALLLNSVEIEPDCRFVEVGSGPGLLAAEAFRRGAEVTCIDTCEQMLDIARMNVPEGEMQLGDATTLEIRRQWADAVVANFVLDLLPDPAAAVLEAARVTKSGGRFAATIWRRHSDNPALGLFYEAASRVGLEVPEATQAGPPLWDRDIFTRTLGRAHLADLEVRTLEWTIPIRPEQWWIILSKSDPVTGGYFASQDAATGEKIRSNFLSLMSDLHSEDDEVMMPVRAMLGSGTVRH
ncbi:MAG TPA: class I SAM-dependent methyltransferase [Acidimicrobiales bacterium]|nr:class I SAM-dependent methyltransferase [Acidimicrobiales bacterium]